MLWVISGDFTLGVAGGGGVAEAQGSFVDFVFFEEFVGFFGHFAREENEETGGEGVKGAGVADFDFVAELLLEVATDFGNDTKATDTGRFVD